MEQTYSFSIVCLTLLLCSMTTVAQLQMSINPQVIVLGSSSPVNTTFTCTISGSASIIDIFTVQIVRKRETDIYFVVIGVTHADANAYFVPTAPQDIVSRGAMSGGIDSNIPTSSTLTLTMSTQDVVCTDKGHYQCRLTYLNANGRVVFMRTNRTLSIYALPHDVSLSARKDNVIIQGTSPGDGAAHVNVGEGVEFTCSAKIGSYKTTRLRWKRTSEFGAGNFIPYQQQEDIDDGTSSSMETDCSYTRTATLRYNVTLSDANPNYDLAFQCYVSVYQPGQGTVETQNPPTFYINAINPYQDLTTTEKDQELSTLKTDQGLTTQETDTACDTSNVVVAAVVVSTIAFFVTVSTILIAIYIVRRKTAGMKNTIDRAETKANVTNQREEVSLDVRVNYETGNTVDTGNSDYYSIDREPYEDLRHDQSTAHVYEQPATRLPF